MSIKPTKVVKPQIYAYTTPDNIENRGWIKIGYTEQEDVKVRIGQQTHTAQQRYNLEWSHDSYYHQGTNIVYFKDHEFHRYLKREQIQRRKRSEWFQISGIDSDLKFKEFISSAGGDRIYFTDIYNLRAEQEEAVRKAKNFFTRNNGGRFLFNAKPRFGKTLTAYELCKRMNARNILIVTNRPSIANSWYSDYEKFVGTEDKYHFVSDSSSLEATHAMKRQDYEEKTKHPENNDWKLIEFISLQDLKGSRYFGGDIEKLKHVRDTSWDFLIIDESHEGVDTIKTDAAIALINAKNILYLSGTPFKAIAKEQFPATARFDWTYTDEQKAKNNFDEESGEENPYGDLPKLNLFTYKLSSMVLGNDFAAEHVEDNSYAFYLNKLFETTEDGTSFIHDNAVDRFLNALTTEERFPFSSLYKNQLNHTFWLLSRVSSVNLLAEKLKHHPSFSEYEIVVAAGQGEEPPDDETRQRNAYNRVKRAILTHEKTITLSVGQLTTGVTIPEWSGVLMLSSIQSPEVYMQTAFRVQNPHIFYKDGISYRKDNAYIFDFEPDRTLGLYERFANELSDNPSQIRDRQKQKNNITELLKFFPVVGEDDYGRMIELDATKVLSILLKAQKEEVVKKGFASDLLFQNVDRALNAPQKILTIIDTLPTRNGKNTTEPVEDDATEENDTGHTDTPEQDSSLPPAVDPYIQEIRSNFERMFEFIRDNENNQDIFNVEQFKESVVTKITRKYSEKYDVTLSSKRTNSLIAIIKSLVEKVYRECLDIYSSSIAVDSGNESQHAVVESINDEAESLEKKLKDSVNSFLDDIQREAKKIYEEEKNKKKKQTKEEKLKEHLKGFTRAVPCLLMAYSDKNPTLGTIDKLTSNDDEFKKITGISPEEFKLLRDGGDIVVDDSGEIIHFDGNLFDEDIFNESITNFMEKKKQLANYFNDNQKENIFDYVPSPKTNLVFTPRKTVIEMVDILEQENPGCFEDPNKKFADLYMKSGMYLAEIVKRLYRSEKMNQFYPNNRERLTHIFSKQIYGCAPNEVLYKLCVNYLLGFSDDFKLAENEHNLKLCDTLAFAKDGHLKEELITLFGFSPADCEVQ